MATKAKPKTREEKLAERRAELDYFAQVEMQRVEQRATHKAERADFLARVEQRRDAEQAALERGETLEAPIIPTLNGEFTRLNANSAQAELEEKRAQVREQRENPLHWVHTLPKAPHVHEQWKQAMFAREAETLGLNQ